MNELIELLKPVVEQILFEEEVQEICTKAQISLDKSKKPSIHCVRKKRPTYKVAQLLEIYEFAG